VDALKRLRAGSYDLMLLDGWMPKMNGLDVLAALPKEGPRPRVVVMTSDDTPETLLRAVREQAWRYVAKPVEPQALAGAPARGAGPDRDLMSPCVSRATQRSRESC
jgi:DNA-binding NtrC family response regulator